MIHFGCSTVKWKPVSIGKMHYRSSNARPIKVISDEHAARRKQRVVDINVLERRFGIRVLHPRELIRVRFLSVLEEARRSHWFGRSVSRDHSDQKESYLTGMSHKNLAVHF